MGYRDSKGRESSRHHGDKSRHGGRRPSHPSSPSSLGPGGHRGGHPLSNGGSGGRRHHGSPSRRSSQDKESRYSSSHSSSGKLIREKLHEDKYNSSEKYYKSDSSRRNFYPQWLLRKPRAGIMMRMIIKNLSTTFINFQTNMYIHKFYTM